MKTQITLKEFSALAADADQINHATAPAIPGSSPQPDDPMGEGFREEMRRRETAPFISAIPYHRWGINE